MSSGITLRVWLKRASMLFCVLAPTGCAVANSSIDTAEPVADKQSYERQVQIDDFISEMVQEHGFSPSQLQPIMADAKTQKSILDAISRPAERTLEWAEYQKIFLTEKRIQEGVRFMRRHRAVLERAEMIYGVPKEIITAIIGVETFYGRIKGSYRVLDALSTLAFDYPPRAEFFRRQLKEYLLLVREEAADPLTLTGSYAGAMGFPQFIPSSYRHYAVDFDGDKKRDIWNNPTDAIGSVANYFKAHGWQKEAAVVVPAIVEGDAYQALLNTSLKPDQTVDSLSAKGFKPRQPIPLSGPASAIRLKGERGDEYWLGLQNFYVITRYNHSRLYAMAVFQLSEAIRKADLKG